MKLQHLFLLLPLVTLGCDPGPPPEIPASVGACEGSCIIFDFYECPESENGNIELCTEKCEHTAGLGYIWTDDKSGPECIVKTKSLDQLRACNVRCDR